MLSDWFDNPVLRREMVVLQRGKIPALLFIAGPLLMGLLFLLYYFIYTLSRTFAPHAVQDGRELFETLSMTLFWGLLLFVPALVGASLHKDRRAGTLSMLRLTNLGSWQLLLGKSAAFAAFYSLVFLATAPVVGMTLLLGGVSTWEFLGIFCLTLAAAIQCSLLSLVSGLVFKRSAAATAVGFVLALAYLFLLPNLVDLLVWVYSRVSGWASWPWLDSLRSWWASNGKEANSYLFPTSAMVETFAPGKMPTLSVGPFEVPFWVVTLASVAVTSGLTLALAAGLLRMELWLRPSRGLNLWLTRAAGREYRTENLLDERRNPFLDWELSRHPVLQHKRALWLIGGACGLIILLVFATSTPTVFNWFGRVVLSLAWLWVTLIPIFYSSQTVVREKEMGTYDSLILSLLQPNQIVESKLKCCLLYATPVLGVSAVACFLGHFTAQPGMTPYWFLQMNFVWLALQVVRCLYYAMLGTFFSLYCQSTLHALAYTIGAEILLTLPYTLLASIFGCCSALFITPMQVLIPHGSLLLVNLSAYLSTMLGCIVPIIFMLVVIRVLYDRAINLMRFESFRR